MSRTPESGRKDPARGVEVTGEDQVQGLPGLGLVLVVPAGVYHPRELATCSVVKPNMNTFSSPASSAISMVAPSRVPTVRAPFIMNFMLLVPLASYPAVEICSETSPPGSVARPG